MNEVEKLYENADIIPRRKCEFDDDCPYGFSHSCDNCDIELTKFNASYPPFTAEKQLKLLQYLTKLELYAEIVLSSSTDLLSSNNDKYSIRFEISDPGFTLEKVYCKTMEEAIAAIINKLWKHLKKEPKQQIKEILE